MDAELEQKRQEEDQRGERHHREEAECEGLVLPQQAVEEEVEAGEHRQAGQQHDEGAVPRGEGRRVEVEREQEEQRLLVHHAGQVRDEPLREAHLRGAEEAGVTGDDERRGPGQREEEHDPLEESVTVVGQDEDDDPGEERPGRVRHPEDPRVALVEGVRRAGKVRAALLDAHAHRRVDQPHVANCSVADCLRPEATRRLSGVNGNAGAGLTTWIEVSASALRAQPGAVPIAAHAENGDARGGQGERLRARSRARGPGLRRGGGRDARRPRARPRSVRCAGQGSSCRSWSMGYLTAAQVEEVVDPGRPRPGLVAAGPRRPGRSRRAARAPHRGAPQGRHRYPPAGRHARRGGANLPAKRSTSASASPASPPTSPTSRTPPITRTPGANSSASAPRSPR